MAEEEDEKVEATGNSGGGMVKIILIVNAVLLLIGIAVGVTWFLMSGDDDKSNKPVDTEVLEVDGGSASADNVPSPAAGRKPIYVPLNPAFVVNFENQDQVSFLQVDIEIMTYDPAVEVALKDHMPRVRNELLLLLGGKQYHEINNREGKRRLSQDAINEIQRVLKEAGAPSAVEALYFTSFVMQ
ncbi:MAG TPA: flagellar basal body-associated FliL family protein [Gammaproteobacteria bacterium]